MDVFLCTGTYDLHVPLTSPVMMRLMPYINQAYSTGQCKVRFWNPANTQYQQSSAVQQVSDILSLCLHPSLSSAACLSAT